MGDLPVFELKEPIYFQAGSEGLVVWLEKSAYVHGSIKNVGDRDLELQFAFTTGETRTVRVSKDGRFGGPVPIGLANVHVIDKTTGAKLKTLFDLRFEPGNVNYEALSEIDLEAPVR